MGKDLETNEKHCERLLLHRGDRLFSLKKKTQRSFKHFFKADRTADTDISKYVASLWAIMLNFLRSG